MTNRKYTISQLEITAKISKSYNDLMMKLGYHKCHTNSLACLKKNIIKYKIDVTHFNTRGQLSKISDEKFSQTVLSSFSIYEVIRKLGYTLSGSTHMAVKLRIQKLDLNTSHFTGQLWNKDKILVPIEDYFNNIKPISSDLLKKRLILEKIYEYKCYCCHNKEWNNEPIPLELHHIDGNHKNNNQNNIIILCPNCHAQTPNYRRRLSIRKEANIQSS